MQEIDWVAIRNDWESGMTYKELSDMYDVPVNTIKSMKRRSKDNPWTRPELENIAPEGVANRQEVVAIERERVARELRDKKVAKELTDKQQLFCIYYIKYFNATKAYLKAYQCSYGAAGAGGHTLLKNPKIQDEISRLKKERFDVKLLSVDAIIQQYIDIAFADITDFVDVEVKEKLLYDDDGNPVLNDEGEHEVYKYNRVLVKPTTDMDGSMVTGITQGKDGISVKLADKMKALEWLAKYSDVLSERTQKDVQIEKMRTEMIKSQKEIDRMDKGDDKEPLKIEVIRK